MINSYAPYRPWYLAFPRYGRSEAKETLRLLETHGAIVIDLETDGLGKKANIVEIAMVEYPSRRIFLNTLLRPPDLEGYANSEAARIHGISLEELQAAPTLPEVWPTIADILAGTQVIVSYNATFDMPVLRNNAQRYGLAVPRLEAVCAMKLYSAYRDSDFWWSLDEAAEQMGIDQLQFGQAHRALADTLTTVTLLAAMRDGV